MSKTTPTDSRAQPEAQSRFSWPMRIFLSCFVFHMVVGSLLALTSSTDTWLEQLDMATTPLALPGAAEFGQIAQNTHPDGYTSRSARVAATLQSAGRFLTPWPSKQTRDKMQSVNDWGKFAGGWLLTRMKFIGKLVGVDQDWPMFSPNVGREATLARFRLIYADETQRIFRQSADVEDLTHYSHWFEEKRLQAELRTHHDPEARLGYCNMLAYRFAANDAGEPMVRIDVFKVNYYFPSPQDDPVEFLREQSGPPAGQIEKVFWYYDVKTRAGHWVKKKKTPADQ